MTRPLDGMKEGFSANGAGMLGQMIKAVRRQRSWNLYVQLAGTKSCATTLENNLAVPQNVGHRVTLWPHSAPPTYWPKKIEHVGLHKTLLDECALVSSIIHGNPDNSWNVVITEMFVIWWPDKQKTLCPYSWILSDPQNEWRHWYVLQSDEMLSILPSESNQSENITYGAPGGLGPWSLPLLISGL